MFICCPHCQENHEVETACDDSVLVCHRCGVEFSVSDQIETQTEQKQDETPESSPNNNDEPIEPIIAQHERIPDQQKTFAAEQTETEEAEEAIIITPPRRKEARIWPWLMIMLTLIISAGFWLQKDAWLDNRWLRSTAINLGYPMPLRDKDWRILPESVQAEWITRDDASTALLIRGRIKNLLTSELPAPGIEITFFSESHPDQKLGSRKLMFTLHPSKLAIRHVPYSRPKADRVPIMPEGEREFVFLIESPPENTGDFTLAVQIQ